MVIVKYLENQWHKKNISKTRFSFFNEKSIVFADQRITEMSTKNYMYNSFFNLLQHPRLAEN